MRFHLRKRTKSHIKKIVLAMEIKIKDKDKLTDATIEVINGVMIVSPKKVKFEPKDGDIVAIYNKYRRVWMVAIFKENQTEFSVSIYCQINGDSDFVLNKSDIETDGGFRLATEEEKQKLFDKLKEEGYKWDANKKELVKLKWKPKMSDIYYNPVFYIDGRFKCKENQWNNDIFDNACYKMGWVFKTEEECEEFCRRLNQAIEGIKP